MSDRDALLQAVINVLDATERDRVSDTPHWILAEIMIKALEGFESGLAARAQWQFVMDDKCGESIVDEAERIGLFNQGGPATDAEPTVQLSGNLDSVEIELDDVEEMVEWDRLTGKPVLPW